LTDFSIERRAERAPEIIDLGIELAVEYASTFAIRISKSRSSSFLI
jgi:hypothetical protein